MWFSWSVPAGRAKILYKNSEIKVWLSIFVKWKIFVKERVFFVIVAQTDFLPLTVVRLIPNLHVH